MRRELSSTFERVLDEPVPDRLIAAIRRGAAGSQNGGPHGGVDAPTATGMTSAGAEAAESSTPHVAPISDLSAARAARAESAERARKARTSWGWPQWGAMAASLVVGAIIGHLALKSPELSSIASRNGHLVAQGGLAEALSNQLASTQPTNAPVQIGTSFKSKDGAYCRTFVLHEGDPVGGLACRAGDAWNVHTLARAETALGSDGGYRPAGSEMPAAVRDAVEAEIAGAPLDSDAETQAKNSGWKK